MSSMHPEQRIKNLLRIVAQQNASDLHLVVGRYPTIRVDGRLIPLEQDEHTYADRHKSNGRGYYERRKPKKTYGRRSGGFFLWF